MLPSEVMRLTLSNATLMQIPTSDLGAILMMSGLWTRLLSFKV